MKRELAVIAALTALSQLAALGKVMLTARIFGVSAAIDGYNLAFVLPILFSGTLAGIIQTGLFPYRARLAQDDPGALDGFERSVLLVLFCLGAGASVLLWMATPYALTFTSANAAPEVREAVRYVLPFATCVLGLNIIVDSSGYLLAMRGKFWIAAAAPITNGVFGALLLAAWPEGGLLNLALGTLIGTFLQAAICVVGLRFTGLRLAGPIWSLVRVFRASADILRLGVLIVPGVIFANVIVALPPIWVASYGPGAVSAFGYAYRIHSAALQLLVMFGSTVILAHFSNLVAQGEHAKIRRIMFESAFFSGAVGLIGIAGVVILGEWVLRIIFGSSLAVSDMQLLKSNWLWLTIGLPFAVFSNVLAKFWQAKSLPLVMSMASGFALIFMIGLNAFWLDGRTPLAAAIATAAVGGAVIFFGAVYHANPFTGLWRKQTENDND